MKKLAAIVLLLALILSMLSGCFRIPKNLVPKPTPSESSQSNSATSEPSAEPSDAQATEDSSPQESSAPVSLKPAGNPSVSFSNYATYKSNAYDRITKAAEGSDSLAMTVGLGYLGVTMVDLSLLTLTMFTDDIVASETAMGMLGMKNAKISGNGNDYTITYTDSEGASIRQTCSYDPGKDQLASTLYDAEGKIAIFFEYVNLGDAYAAQYYFPSDDSYQIIRAYFDKDNVAAFGILSAADEPPSILGKSGFNAEFVKNDESYLILTDGKLTVYDNGTTTTN